MKLPNLNNPYYTEPTVTRFSTNEGYSALALRPESCSRHLCGYVGLPPSHRFHGLDTNQLEFVKIHGGVTFTGTMEGDDLWWIGFDCMHGCDCGPFEKPTKTKTYKTLQYVCTEIAELSKFLFNYEKG